MERLINITWLFPASLSGIGMLAYYHAIIKPAIWGFLLIAIFYRLFAHGIWRISAAFYLPAQVPNDMPPHNPAHQEKESDDKKEKNDDAKDYQEVEEEKKEKEEKAPEQVPVLIRRPPASVQAKHEAEAMAWALQYAESETSGYIAKKLYRFYELWIPLALRTQDEHGIPRWVAVMEFVSRTPVILSVVALAISLAFGFSSQIAQNPILGLINCDKEMINAALHCDAYTETCHLTPPCGPNDVDYIQLVETYHNRCAGSAYPKIAMIKNICFMEKDGISDNNSWKHVWMKMVGSDFYSLEHTLISFYQDSEYSANHLRERMNEPTRVFYDQIGSLVGYGVNTVTPNGLIRTNINHDDLMTTLTTWRNKKLPERKRKKPCICAPHLGIINRMIFMWDEDIPMWKIYVDHNVSDTNNVYPDSKIVPRYDDFPRNVDSEIAVYVRGEDSSRSQPRIHPGASTIDLLEISTNVANVRPIDLQTTQQIHRHWSVEGPVLQSQIPHVYFDASLEAYRSSNNLAFSGMSPRDGEIVSKRITDPIAACYYQCARIFDEVSES